MEKVKPNLFKSVSGIRIPVPFNSDRFRETLNYKPIPEDVFIVTYPKCGTTWMQNIALSIFRKGKELEDPSEFHRLCPFIDNTGNEGMINMPRPGTFKSHLPFNSIPYSTAAKYVYVLRNPKDCCVSMYYHTKRKCRATPWSGDFNEFFEMFMDGDVEYNDYFDHLMSWYPHRNDNNIFFTTYEDMKKDTESIVLKLAAFLGKQYIDAIHKDNTVLHNILNFSSFEYMKNHLSKYFDHARRCDSNVNREYEGNFKQKEETLCLSLENPEFFRKGEIGDYKNHFSEEQSERMMKKFFETLKGTEIIDMYKSFM